MSSSTKQSRLEQENPEKPITRHSGWVEWTTRDRGASASSPRSHPRMIEKTNTRLTLARFRPPHIWQTAKNEGQHRGGASRRRGQQHQKTKARTWKCFGTLHPRSSISAAALHVEAVFLGSKGKKQRQREGRDPTSRLQKNRCNPNPSIHASQPRDESSHPL